MNAKQRGSIRFSFLENLPEDTVAAPKALSLEQITETEDDVLTEEESKKGTLRKATFSNRRALSVLKTVDFEGQGGTMSWKLDGRVVAPQTISEGESLASLLTASVDASVDAGLDVQPTENEHKEEPKKQVKKQAPSGLFSGLAADVAANKRKTTIPAVAAADGKTVEEDIIPEGRSVEELAPLSDFVVSFSKITMGNSAQKSFEINNTGETILELTLKDLDGQTVRDNKLMPCPGGLMELSVSPTHVRLPPSMTCVFEFSVNAIAPGKDGMDFVLSLSNMVSPQLVPVHVSATVVPITTSENLKAFVRSDTSVDHKIKMPLIEEALYVTDPDIWKVLVPVLRLSSLRPSMDCRRVPYVEVCNYRCTFFSLRILMENA
jgi:hypothetical protein